MTALCTERLPFNGCSTKRKPALAMDAALSSTGNGKLIGDDVITQVLDLLRGLLDPETFKKVEGPLLAKSKMSMDQPAPRTFKAAPENVARAADLLRGQGVDEGVIDEVYRICGTPKPTQAEDSARHARAYAERFPGQIGGAAKLPTPSSATSYAERFPGAARIRVL